MIKRQVFFSFHYDRDSWRAAQVRGMGKFDDDSSFCDNDWEKIKNQDEDAIKKWIDAQLEKRSCLVVLIGAETAERKWVQYEIKKACELNKGIVGIYIHKLKDWKGNQDTKGNNPFDYFIMHNNLLSSYVQCCDPFYEDSKDVYKYIENNIENLIENALKNRPCTWKNK